MRPIKHPTHCIGCGREFRPWNAKAKDHPGMKSHAGHGRCHGCRNQARREALTTPALGEGDLYPFTDEALSHMPADVAAYHLRRRPHREALRAARADA